MNTLNWDKEIKMLTKAGFIESKIGDKYDKSGINEPIFEGDHGDHVFYHKSNTRQNIAIQLLTIDQSDEYKHFCVYVRADFGMNWICMPFRWSNLEYWWLNLLKISLDGVCLDESRPDELLSTISEP